MAIIKLTIYVDNITNVISLFDRIQVERSESGEGGPFFPITDATAMAATLLGTQTGPFNVNGETLKFKVDGGAEQEVAFVSADPVTIDNVVGEVNGQATGVTASEDTGALKLTSDTTGTGSLLEITDGTALTDLGFIVDDEDNGEDAYIILVDGTTEYLYDDRSGASTNYYRTRYYHTVQDIVSDYSDPVLGDVASIIPSGNLIKGFLDLAGLDGQPVADRLVTFYNKYIPPIVVSDIGVVDRVLSVSTDQAGHAETMLIRGAVVDVMISGTNLVREITVPDSGTEFNLMSPIAIADDSFQIQIPDIPTAVRRS